MPKRSFGNTGVKISKLCLVGVSFGIADSDALLDEALRSGVDCWEIVSFTGKIYSEYFKKYPRIREKIFLTGKVYSLDPIVMQGQLNNLLKENETSITFKFDEDFPQILCDKGLMKSVFINLINNAYEEVGKNGAIEVGGKPVGNNRAEIWVADNGTGINEEINSIFLKFKSTKGGVGIGLSLVKKIVNEHFGKISVESAPDKGTKFIIEIPTDYHFIERRSGKERRESRERREGDK